MNLANEDYDRRDQEGEPHPQPPPERRKLLCRLGLHNRGPRRSRAFEYHPSAVLLDWRCTRPGCDDIKTELWWKGRKL